MNIFCLNCGKELESYKTIPKEMDIEFKGSLYKYNGLEAVCPECGEPLLVEEILRYNRKKAYDAFRKANDIISYDEVISIPEKFNISKRNISKYLGWGDVTFSRYCSGYVPTKHNSEILREIIDNPEILTEKIKKYINDHPDDKNAIKDLQKMNSANLYDAIIDLRWDDDSKTWTATSKDIPGLVLESDSFDELTERVKSSVPDLLKPDQLPDTLMLEFHAKKKEVIYA